jgi:hypothetical protein
MGWARYIEFTFGISGAFVCAVLVRTDLLYNFVPDGGSRGWLADLCADAHQVRARYGGIGAVSSDAAAGAARRPCGRSIRPQDDYQHLSDHRGAHVGVACRSQPSRQLQ